jgi:hypothetical protein
MVPKVPDIFHKLDVKSTEPKFSLHIIFFQFILILPPYLRLDLLIFHFP